MLLLPGYVRGLKPHSNSCERGPEGPLFHGCRACRKRDVSSLRDSAHFCSRPQDFRPGLSSGAPPGLVIPASRLMTYADGLIPSPKGMSSAMLSSRNAAGPKVLIGGGAGTFFFFLLLLFERRGRRFRTHIHRVEEGHHAAQACAHFFEQLVLLTLADRIEPGTTLLVFRYPLAGVSAVADFIENAAHFGTRLVSDNARAAGVVAVLGGITHRVAHVTEATAID